MDTSEDIFADYQWKNRILVVFSTQDDTSNDLLQKQIELFSDNKKELEERDLIVFQIFKDKNIEKGVSPIQKSISGSDIDKLKKRFDFVFDKENRFVVFLVGKDGQTKLKTENEILGIEKLFGIIDAMPMRQNEIRKDKN